MRNDFCGFPGVRDGAQDIAACDIAAGLGNGCVSTHVIRMRMGTDHVTDRPVGQLPNRRQQPVAQFFPQGIDDEHALLAHLNGCVAGFADQHEDIALHGQHADLAPRPVATVLGEGAKAPEPGGQQRRCSDTHG